MSYESPINIFMTIKRNYLTKQRERVLCNFHSVEIVQTFLTGNLNQVFLSSYLCVRIVGTLDFLLHPCCGPSSEPCKSVDCRVQQNCPEYWLYHLSALQPAVQGHDFSVVIIIAPMCRIAVKCYRTGAAKCWACLSCCKFSVRRGIKNPNVGDGHDRTLLYTSK